MISNSPIAPNWRYFFTVQLPVALVILAVAAEVFAFAADAIPHRRHDLDLLALNVERPTSSTSSVVIVGDSVTQDILKTYAIGAEGDVANLTTNQASGLVGAYFLIKRYLAHQSPPRHVVIASTPEFFTFEPSGETARIYLKTVFRQHDEVGYLKAYLQDDEPFYSPAILNMDQRLGLKAVALLAPAPRGLLMGDRIPDAARQPQPLELSVSILDNIRARGHKALNIPEANIKVLADICALAVKYNFNIHILNAPIPQSAYASWMHKGILQHFEADRSAFLNKACPQARVANDGSALIVPDEAMRDADHLVRHDWTNVYAVILDNLVRELSN